MKDQFVKEAVASARSHPVASGLTVLAVVAMVLTVMLTTGRAVGAERQILGSIDSASSRAIVIRASAAGGLDASAVQALHCVGGVEWVGAFSSAVDATNSTVVDSNRVPLRYVYSDDFTRLGIDSLGPFPGQSAWGSKTALRLLGLVDVVGGVSVVGGPSFGVQGALNVPDFLTDFEPLILVPKPAADTSIAVSLVIVVAQSPGLIDAVTKAVLSVLPIDDPSSLTVETSATLAELRSIIQDQLGDTSQALVLISVTLTGALVAGLEYGLVMMRRRDFGRRRALGASRGFIVALVVAQTAILALIGIAVGFTGALFILLFNRSPLPDGLFFAALAILALATTTAAAIVPAIAASRRDPVTELRVA